MTLRTAPLLLLLTAPLHAADAPKHLETDPAKVLDAERYPDAGWADALRNGNKDEAVGRYIEHLRTRPRLHLERFDQPHLHKTWQRRRIPRGEPRRILRQEYAGPYGTRYRFKDEIDWLKPVTRHMEGVDFTREWQWQFNRHQHWLVLAEAHRRTGEAKYARAWQRELDSWLAQCPPPEDGGGGYPSAWRQIEAGIRIAWTWPGTLETFRKSEAVADRALWRMVCSIRQHGRYMAAHRMGWVHNMAAIQAQGLVFAGAMLPELDGAPRFVRLGLEQMRRQQKRGVYPDGMHVELAPAYGAMVATNAFSAFGQAEHRRDDWGRGAGKNMPRPTDSDWAAIYNMAEAYGRLADPTGTVPPLHDSRPVPATAIYDSVAPLAPERFEPRPWTTGQSSLLPWGGYAVLRRDDRWALLDAGPWGSSGHRHDDTLQLLLHDAGQKLLIDPGKPPYTNSPIARHLRASAAHNVVQLDGRTHHEAEPIKKANKPLPIAHHAAGSLRIAAAMRTLQPEGDGSDRPPRFDHERIVIDAGAQLGVLVIDRLQPRDDRPHEWSSLWHTAAERIEVTGEAAVARYGDGVSMRVRAMVVGNKALALDTVRGQREGGRVQGWHGWRSDSKGVQPIPTLRIGTDRPVRGALELATLLRPRDPSSDGPAVRLTGVSRDGATLRVTIKDGEGRHMYLLESPAGAQTERLICEPEAGRRRVVELDPHRRAVGR